MADAKASGKGDGPELHVQEPLVLKEKGNGKADLPTPGDLPTPDDLPLPDDLPVPPTPPDGGWGWVIVFASLLINMIVDGVTYSFTVFLPDLRDYFRASNAKVALVGSLIPGLYLSIAPISGALANKFGCRALTIAGSIVAFCGFLASTFSPNVDVLIVTYGVIGGIGFGLMYLPAIVIVNFYFEKMRAFATGIAVCGSGLGTLIFAPLSRFLLQKYSWKGGNLIMAGIVLNGIPLGGLFRPLMAAVPKKKKPKPGRPETEMEVKVPKSIIMQKILADRERQRTISTGSLDGTIITTDNQLLTDPEEIRRTKERLLSSAYSDLKGHTGGSVPTIVVTDSDNKQNNANTKDSEKKLMVEGTGSDADMKSNGSGNVSFSPLPIPNRQVSRLRSEERPGHLRKRTVSIGSAKSQELTQDELMRKSMENLRKEVSRPLVRKDIFYSGSIATLNEYKSASDIHSYIRSTTSLPPDAVGGGRCAPFCNGLLQLFDFRVLKNPAFLMVGIASFLAMMGFFTPYVFTSQAAASKGGDFEAFPLVSIMGTANVFGRILAGWLSDRPWADSVFIHNWALIVAGGITCCVPLLPSYPFFVLYSVLYGLCTAAYISLRSIVLVDLLGLETLTSSFGLLLLFQGLASLLGTPIAAAYVSLRSIVLVDLLGLETLTSSFGLLLLFQGIASLLGTPVAGMFIDSAGGITSAYLASGAFFAVAGILCLPVRCVSRRMAQSKRDDTVYVAVTQNEAVV